MSPEMLLDQGFDEKADVYSFGIVLWELLTQEEPYKGQYTSFEDLVDAVTKKGKRPDIPAECPPKLKQVRIIIILVIVITIINNRAFFILSRCIVIHC